MEDGLVLPNLTLFCYPSLPFIPKEIAMTPAEYKAWDERAKKIVSPDVVEAVENLVGMGIGAWDTIDPRLIIMASYEVMAKEVRLEGF